MSRSSPRWQLRMLGPATLVDGEQVVRPHRRRSLVLLAYLCLHEGGASRDGLCALFWPDADEGAARAGLRTVLSELRSILGAAAITASHEHVALLPGARLGWDLQLLESDTSDAWQWDEKQWNALSGVFLEGLQLPGCEALEEWIYFQRQRASHLLCLALERACLQCLTNREPAKAQALAMRWQRIDPLSEPACALVLRACMAQGRADLAQAHWVDFATRLREELGISPSARTRALLDMPAGDTRFEPVSAVAVAAPGPAGATLSDVRYVLSGTAYIAWRSLTARSDAPWLIFINGFVSHLELVSAEPGLLSFFSELARRFRVILFDKRGMGLSDRTGSPPTLQETAADVVAVLSAAGAHTATLMGVSEGGPAALYCAVEHAERVERLVLYGTAARWTADDDYPHVITSAQYDKWMERLQHQWGGALHLKQFAPSRAGDAALIQWWSMTLRLAASPGSICAVLSSAREFDVRSRLAEVRQPTLVLHRLGDQLLRIANAGHLAEHIPNASLVTLPGHDHWFWLEEPAAFIAAVDEFLQGKA